MNTMINKIDIRLGRRAIYMPCVVLAGVCLLACGSQALAEDKLPSGDDVLNRYIEVTGGRAAYEKIHNSRTKSKLELVGMGMGGSMTAYSSEPNNMFVVVEIEALGRIEQGYDGTVAWEVNPMTGPRIKEGKEKLITQRQSYFNSELNWKTIYKKVECVGLESEEGVDYYKVVMTPKEGEVETRFYNKKTGLLSRTEMMVDSQMGELNIKVILEDYKKIGDVLIPHKMTQDAGVQKMAFTIESVEYNIDIPKDRFDLPADIKELLEETKVDETKKAE